MRRNRHLRYEGKFEKIAAKGSFDEDIFALVER